MTNSFIQKLIARAHLDADDIAALHEATQDISEIDAGRDLVLEGSVQGVAYIILDGFACRYKLVPDGGRSILAYLVAGDGCDLHASLLNRAINSVATLTPCTIAAITYRAIKELAASRPNIYRALWWSVLVDEAVLQEWLVGIGRRSPDKQIAHLLCELLARLRALGLATEPDYRLPLTQSELADTAGLSNVHIARVLAELRSASLIKSGRKSISVPDIGRLQAFAGFDPSYLMLSGARPEFAELGALPRTTSLVH